MFKSVFEVDSFSLTVILDILSHLLSLPFL